MKYHVYRNIKNKNNFFLAIEKKKSFSLFFPLVIKSHKTISFLHLLAIL